jgi:hypothetical protein
VIWENDHLGHLMDDWLAKHEPELDLEGVHLKIDTSPVVTVHKITGYQEISRELLDEVPLTPAVPLPWHIRAHWRWLAWRERVGRKVGGWLAGVDLSEREDDW